MTRPENVAEVRPISYYRLTHRPTDRIQGCVTRPENVAEVRLSGA
ncbi:hypothetical protein [Baaleninema sp.]